MNDKQLVIERVFNAPRELVFKAWTEADRLAQWWGPKGANIEVKQLDLRPGGMFHYYLSAANGSEMWGRFVYEEILAPERLVFVSSFSDKDANATHGPFFDGVWPLVIRNILTLEDANGKTKLKLTGQPINATAEEMKMYAGMITNMEQGFGGTFDQLDDYLAKQ